MEQTNQDGNSHENALSKLTESAYRYSQAKDGLWLQSIEGLLFNAKEFKERIKIGLNCKLKENEILSLLPNFETNGSIDGSKFSLYFRRLSFQHKSKLKSDLIAQNRIKRENKLAEEENNKLEQENKKSLKITSFTEADKTNALDKVKEAAFRYDRLMPGAVQLDAFEVQYMEPFMFKDQLLRCFNVQLTSNELAALVRIGFEEKTRRYRDFKDEAKRLKQERDLKIKEEKALLDKKNSLKVSYLFSKADKDSVLKKLREAAKLYDAGASSMKAFETAFMEPHVFKEQLKRVFNLKVTAPELGALMKVFDIDGDGTVSCAEFSKIFISMGCAEREREIKEYKEKQKLAELNRKNAAESKERELAAKNASKVSYEYDDVSFQSALSKLTEAAWAFDKNAAGAPNLTAFDSKDMEPHVFKEQLKRAFNLSLLPPELGALMSIFDPEKKGKVECYSFLTKFLKVGMGERLRRNQLWRGIEQEREKERLRLEAEKKKIDDEKLLIKVVKFNQEEFSNALQKLTDAACKYEKGAPGAVALTAFEIAEMLPHVFKEQLKLVFGVKVSNQELSALLHYFGNDEMLNCREFVVKFIRLGIDERTRQRISWKEEDKAKKEKALVEIEEQLIKNGLRGKIQIDYNFLEEHFDSALNKLIDIAHKFDPRQVGPGFKKLFEVSFFTPEELKEILKRTFNIKTNAQEIGVFVSYFDTSLTGKVSTAAFLNSFMKMRVRIEDFKGDPNEKDLLKAYQSQLKEAYKKKISRITQVTNDSSLKPWKSSASQQAFSRTQHKPYPKSAPHKLRRRLNLGIRTGKLDLSTQTLWNESSISDAEESLKQFDSSPNVADEKPANIAADMKKEIAELSKKSGKLNFLVEAKSKHQKKIADDLNNLSSFISVFTVDDNISVDRVTRNVPESSNEIENVSDKIAQNKNIKKVINFKLSTIPTEVFNMLALRELWLCGNHMGSVPSQIGELKQLKVLSLALNNLETIPPEICLIENLTCLYLQHNKLKNLPDIIYRLKNLTDFNLSVNCFEVFPESICTLTSLLYLDLNNNSIGSLPSSLKNMRSLARLNISNNQIVSPEEVLSKMWWVEVIPTCAVMNSSKSANVWKFTPEESNEYENFFKKKAKAIKERKQYEKEYKLMNGVLPTKPKKNIEKIILR